MLSSAPQLVADATHGINWSVWLSLGAKIENISTRLSKLEQHCVDIQTAKKMT